MWNLSEFFCFSCIYVLKIYSQRKFFKSLKISSSEKSKVNAGVTVVSVPVKKLNVFPVNVIVWIFFVKFSHGFLVLRFR